MDPFSFLKKDNGFLTMRYNFVGFSKIFKILLRKYLVPKNYYFKFKSREFIFQCLNIIDDR